MAMITDIDYVLQAIRLSALRQTDDPLTPRIISIDPNLALNPYINASGLSDVDRWPEIKRALDSPPPDYPSSYESVRNARAERASRDRSRDRLNSRNATERGRDGLTGEAARGGGGLNYTQTIMGARSGGMGMRVDGIRTSQGENDSMTSRRYGRGLREKGAGIGTGMGQRANSSEALSPMTMSEKNPITPQQPNQDLFSPSRRPRADSAPAPALLGIPPIPPPPIGGRYLGSSVVSDLESSVLSENSESRSSNPSNPGSTKQSPRGIDDPLFGMTKISLASPTIGSTNGDGNEEGGPEGLEGDFEAGRSDGIGESARPSNFGLTAGDAAGRLGETMVDEGSDIDENEMHSEMDMDDNEELMTAKPFLVDSRRSSVNPKYEAINFTPITIPSQVSTTTRPSALTSALNKHIPHLVSTASNMQEEESAVDLQSTVMNPFTLDYASVAAQNGSASMSLEIYFPHSDEASIPLIVKVRKDATVEEVTGYGLYKYWEENRQPSLSEEEEEVKWTTIGWGLRIVEDDGEVDEDFPPLDRDSKASKFSYGQFAIVEATPEQIKQNAAKVPPHMSRRPTQLPQTSQQAVPGQSRPSVSQRPSTTSNVAYPDQPTSPISTIPPGGVLGSVGFSSPLSKQVLLRIRITASADVHFTTTISVPSDMYIADLTEILCKKKRLSMPYTDWVLCLADLTIAIPVDRTVASLEGKNDLALVKTQWAAEHGLRIGDRRGGDPNASIFKRQSEQNPAQKFGQVIADFAQTYKKYTVYRKIAIGRHERVVAIDGDYIHIMPSESRAFFDSMKTTSFHISLVASVKLSGRSGGFKINVWREGMLKKYEFEAENAKQANEIVDFIKSLMRSFQAERSSMMPPPRTVTKR